MIRNRLPWLARPWFLVAVLLLALNDHLFKATWPGPVTGKLSDVAGLVVVATLVSVLVGPGPGTVLAGVAFLALKTVPGVAEAVAPLLGGGVTLRDPTDLVALLALPPLWVVLRRRGPVPSSRTRRGWAVLGLLAAVAATTATTPPPPSEVRAVGYTDGAFHAEVYLKDGYGSRWMRSTDAGVTWAREDDPGPIPEAERLGHDGSQQSCVPDGVCLRVAGVHVAGSQEWDRGWWIQRRVPGGDWRAEKYLGSSSYRVNGIAIDPASSEHAVVAVGTTVQVRTPSGAWRAVDLVAPASDPEWQRELVTSLGTPGFGFVVFLLASLLGWLLVPWLAARVVFQVMNVLALGVVFVLGVLASPVRRVQMYATWALVVVVLAVLMRLTWWLDRRSRRAAGGTEPTEARSG